MSDDPRVLDLLNRWEEGKESGQILTAEELCRDCPELLDTVRRAIRSLEEFDRDYG